MESATLLRLEISRSLAPVRRTLVLRQGVRLLAGAAAWGALGVMVGLLFFQLLPWLVGGSVPGLATLACATSGVLGAISGGLRKSRGWNWPSEEDCALVLSSHNADGSLPTAIGLREESAFAPPVLRAAREAVTRERQISLGAAVSTPNLIAAPLLALLATVMWIACAGLPVDSNARTPQGVTVPNATSRHSAPAPSDIAAFEQAMGERRQQDALSKAASDLRDEGKSDQERQKSLDEARAEVAKAGKPLPSEIPQAVPSAKTAREALAEKLEAAAAAAGARAEAFEKTGRGAAATDNGGDVKAGGSAANTMQAAPDYEARRFENTSEALSDQSPPRRELAQGAVDKLAKIKQGR